MAGALPDASSSTRAMALLLLPAVVGACGDGGSGQRRPDAVDPLETCRTVASRCDNALANACEEDLLDACGDPGACCQEARALWSCVPGDACKRRDRCTSDEQALDRCRDRRGGRDGSNGPAPDGAGRDGDA